MSIISQLLDKVKKFLYNKYNTEDKLAIAFLIVIMIIALIRDGISALSRRINLKKFDNKSNIDNINTIKIESKLTETENNEFIDKLNKIYKKYMANIYKRIIFVVLLFISFINIKNSLWSILPCVGFLVLTCLTIKKIFIALDFTNDSIKPEYNLLISSIDKLIQIQKLVEVETITITSDYKKQAGASSLLKTSSNIKIHKKLGFVRLDSEMRMIELKHIKLLFLPNMLVCYNNKKWYLINYKDLNINYINTRFIETGNIPKDTQIIDGSWKFRNKDGSPDLRFNNNKKLPVCAYAEIEITSTTGLRVVIMGSNRDKIYSFANNLKNFIITF